MLTLILCIVFISFGAVFLALFLVEKIRRYSVKETMLKSVASLFFIATCAVGLYKSEGHVLPLFAIFGLLLGLLGDIWLDFKYVFPQHDKTFTYAGFAVFGLGHILYVSGMFYEYYHGENIFYIIVPIAAGLVAGTINVLLEKPMKLKMGEFKLTVLAYGSLLFITVGASFSMLLLNGFNNTTLWMIFVGSLFFAISDLILSGTYFGEGKERPVDIITNAITYYIAQYLIAFAIFFM